MLVLPLYPVVYEVVKFRFQKVAGIDGGRLFGGARDGRDPVHGEGAGIVDRGCWRGEWLSAWGLSDGVGD